MKRFSVGAATHLGVVDYLNAHEAPVRCLSVSRDGGRLASGAEDQTVRVWDVPARRVRHVLAHEGEVYAVALSADGKHLVSGGGDCTVRFWNPDTAAAVHTVDGDMHVVTALALDPSGARALAGFDDGTLLVLDVATGKRVKKLAGPTGAIWGVAFSPDGARAASGDWDGKVIVWDVASGKRLAEREGHQRNFGGVAFTASGGDVIYPVEEAVRIASADGKRAPRVLEQHESALYALASNGRHLLTGGGEGRDVRIGLWDIETDALLHTFQVHDGGNRALALTGDGKLGFSAGYHDRRIAILDLDSRPPLTRDEGHPGPLMTAAFAPAAGTVVTAGADRSVRVFSLADGAQRCVVELGEYALPGTVEVPADGKTAAVTDGSTLHTFDLSAGVERGSSSLGDYPRVIAMSPDGTRVAVGHEKVIRLHALAAGGKPTALKGHKDSVSCLAFSADGGLLASGAEDYLVSVWDASTASARGKPLKGHTSAVTAVAFAAAGRLISASRDQTLRIWDLERNRLVTTLEGHQQWITALAVSADGTRALSCADGDRDGRVRLWDLVSGRELARFDPHHGDAFRLAFSPEGKRGYSISRDDRAVVAFDLVA